MKQNPSFSYKQQIAKGGGWFIVYYFVCVVVL